MVSGASIAKTIDKHTVDHKVQPHTMGWSQVESPSSQPSSGKRSCCFSLRVAVRQRSVVATANDPAVSLDIMPR